MVFIFHFVIMVYHIELYAYIEESLHPWNKPNFIMVYEFYEVLLNSVYQNFPQFIVIHTVKGFGIVSKAEIDVFLELSCFFHDPADVGNLISGASAFSKTSLNISNYKH